MQIHTFTESGNNYFQFRHNVLRFRKRLRAYCSSFILHTIYLCFNDIQSVEAHNCQNDVSIVQYFFFAFKNDVMMFNLLIICKIELNFSPACRGNKVISFTFNVHIEKEIKYELNAGDSILDVCFSQKKYCFTLIIFLIYLTLSEFLAFSYLYIIYVKATKMLSILGCYFFLRGADGTLEVTGTYTYKV